MRRLRWAALAAALSMQLLSSCSAKAEDPVVVKSDLGLLHVSEVRQLVDGLSPDARQQIKNNPQVLAGLLKQEVEKRALQKQIEDQHWDQRPEVKAEIEKARAEVVMNSFLRSVSDAPSAYPAEADIEQAYKLNQQRFLVPRQFHLAQIYLAEPPSGADAAVEARAAELVKQLRGTPDRFADLARTKSDDKASASQGGDLGWLPETQITPEIRSVVLGMGKGEVSEPIRINGGWHVVRLLDTKAATTRSLDEVKPELTQLLRRQKAQESAVAYMNKLLLDEHAAIDEISLEKVTSTLH